MKALIILSHPEPQSFTAALARMAKSVLEARQIDVRLIDLHVDGFNPVSGRSNFTTVYDTDYFKPQAEERHASQVGGFSEDLRRYQDAILNVDIVLLCFPLWWGGFPAMLKGWIDRVYASGVSYGGGRAFATGVMAGKRLLLVLTTGAEAFSNENFGPLDQVLYPIHRCFAEFVGYSVLPDFVVHAPARISNSARQSELSRLQTHLDTHL